MTHGFPGDGGPEQYPAGGPYQPTPGGYPQQPGFPPYGYPQQRSVREHPQATVILVVGILSLVLCQLLGPVAWVMANSALREIDASGGMLGGRGNVEGGRICGIIATVLVAAGVLVLVLGFVFVGLLATSAPS